MKIEFENRKCIVRAGGMTSVVEGNVSMAHMGCGLGARLKPAKDANHKESAKIVEYLNSQYGTIKVWGDATNATKRLARALFG